MSLLRFKLLAVKDNQSKSLLTTYTIFLCRGRGYKRIKICTAFSSYISLHPYHSYNDVTVHSEIELYRNGDMVITKVYYYELQFDEKVINDNTRIFISKDNGLLCFIIWYPSHPSERRWGLSSVPSGKKTGHVIS